MIEEQVWEQVASWLNNPDEIAAALQQEKTKEPFEAGEIARIEKEIEMTKNARKKLIKLFAASEDGIAEEDKTRIEGVYAQGRIIKQSVA